MGLEEGCVCVRRMLEETHTYTPKFLINIYCGVSEHLGGISKLQSMLESLSSPFFMVDRKRFYTQGNLTCPGSHTAWGRFWIKLSRILTHRHVSMVTLDRSLLCVRCCAKGWMCLSSPLLLEGEAGIWSDVCLTHGGKDMRWSWFFLSGPSTRLGHAAAGWSSSGGSTQSEGSSHKCWRGLESAEGFCRQGKTE